MRIVWHTICKYSSVTKKPNDMTPKAIVETAKNELVNAIIIALRKLDAFIATGDKRMMTSPDEDIVIDESEVLGEMPKILGEVDNSYLDVEDRTYKRLPIDKFVLSEGEFYVECNGVEFFKDDLSIEELQDIAQFLQEELEKDE